MGKVKETCTILSQECIGKDIYSMWIETKTIAEQAKPGQFVSVYTATGANCFPAPSAFARLIKKRKHFVLCTV